jgi:uncharacterized protein (TIGR03435 family)
MDITEYTLTAPGSGDRLLSMNTTKKLLVVSAVFGVASAFAQVSPRPEFEVATIRPSTLGPQDGVTAGVRIDGAQVRCVALTLKDYVGIGYRVKLYQISGPDWIGSVRFDISATFPAGGASQFTEMLQHLLEDRFQIKVHREKKDFPVYVLEVAKGGLKMQESAPDPNAEDAQAPLTVTGGGSAQGVSVNLGRGSSYTFGNNKFEAKRLTMTALAGNLERFLDRPIVDMTDLKGSYDFALDVTPEDYRAMLIHAAVAAGVSLPPEALRLLDGASTPSLFDAMQKVGLKLDARKAPLDMVVVDDARKTPTDN